MEAKYQAAKSAKQMTFFIELPLPRGLEQQFTQASGRACPSVPCDRKAFLRGLFIGCGSVNAPSARYHLELVLPTVGWATAIARLLQEQGVRAGVTERAGHQLLYLKDGDGIVRTLSLMGASRAVMEFENVRVVREVSGQVNRRLNFETANIDKTIGSAMRQVTAIEQLDHSGRLGELSPALREVAQARRSNPDLNLAELAVRMRLSKSAVNHRLRPGGTPARRGGQPARVEARLPARRPESSNAVPLRMLVALSLGTPLPEGAAASAHPAPAEWSALVPTIESPTAPGAARTQSEAAAACQFGLESTASAGSAGTSTGPPTS